MSARGYRQQPGTVVEHRGEARPRRRGTVVSAYKNANEPIMLVVKWEDGRIQRERASACQPVRFKIGTRSI